MFDATPAALNPLIPAIQESESSPFKTTDASFRYLFKGRLPDHRCDGRSRGTAERRISVQHVSCWEDQFLHRWRTLPIFWFTHGSHKRRGPRVLVEPTARFPEEPTHRTQSPRRGTVPPFYTYFHPYKLPTHSSQSGAVWPTGSSAIMGDNVSYDEALRLLSSLISGKRRTDGKNWSHAFEMMQSYLEVRTASERHDVRMVVPTVPGPLTTRLVAAEQRLELDKDLDKLSVIHVAGTKGKGSTCAMVERMLRQCGYKTGLYTSPHLLDVRERIRIDG